MTTSRTRQLTYGERALRQKELQDWIAEKPRRGDLIAAAQIMEAQRANQQRARKRK
jgi:hypothetical protein